MRPPFFLYVVPQLLAIINSLLNMAWCIASYHRCIRWSQVDKIKISWWGTCMQWLCHFLVSGTIAFFFYIFVFDTILLKKKKTI